MPQPGKPHPHSGGRKPITKEQREEFLRLRAEGNAIRWSCEHAGFHHTTLYRTAKRLPAFAAELEDANEATKDTLLQFAWDIVSGRVEANGPRVRMLEKMLAANLPDEYGDRQRIEHGNADGRPFEIRLAFDPNEPADEDEPADDGG